MADLRRSPSSINDNFEFRNYNLEYERQVVDLVNKQRAEAGLHPLRLSDDISYVARLKSNDMIINRYFSHQSPTYGSPFDMLIRFGINYKTAGENIAKGQQTAQAVMTAWINSEAHRKNILNPDFNEIGVGYTYINHQTPYWTQMFLAR